MRCGAKEAKRREERVRLQRDLYETKREEVVQLLLSHPEAEEGALSWRLKETGGVAAKGERKTPEDAS